MGEQPHHALITVDTRKLKSSPTNEFRVPVRSKDVFTLHDAI